jgi:hypothetical protein
VKRLALLALPALIAAALGSPAHAQDECAELEGVPPGLYTSTDEGRTYVNKDGEVLELKAGQSGIADEKGVRCIKQPPQFLDWPCSTQAAQSRMFNTYTIDELTSANPMKEVVERYFQVPEVIAPIPNWIDGEFHGNFNYNDIIQFSTPDYWYHPNERRPILSEKRPRSLLISLYVGTNEVLIDNNMIDALRAELSTNDLPVTFVFNDSNTVPISYFGSNVSLEEVFKAFVERKIKVAEVPMWWLGDYHLLATVEEYDKFFEIPALEDISPERQEALRADLQEHGFSRKSIIVSLFLETTAIAVDPPERLRVAASMGYDRIPTTLNFIEPHIILARCGPGTPVGSGGVSGSTTPISGAFVPPTATNTTAAPPPPEPGASDS